MVHGASSTRNRLLAVAVAAVFGGVAIPQGASAALISVFDAETSSLGIAAAIVAAPADVNDDAETNQAQQGFDEQQRYTTMNNIATDMGVILAGTRVDSHMIFLNTTTDPNPGAVTHFNVEWTFDGRIIGVMSDGTGSLEVGSSDELGAENTLYPVAAFRARGLEGGSSPDGYEIIAPDTIRVDMRVTEPGDWIRVVTKPIPEPSTAMLLGLGLFGLAGRRRLNA